MYTKIFSKLLGVRLMTAAFVGVIALQFMGTSLVAAAGYVPTPSQPQDAVWSSSTTVTATLPLTPSGYSGVNDPTTFTGSLASAGQGAMLLDVGPLSSINASIQTQVRHGQSETVAQPNMCKEPQIQIGYPTIINSYQFATTYTLTTWFDAHVGPSPIPAPCGSLGNTKNYTGTLDNSWASANDSASWTPNGDISWSYPGWSSTFTPSNNAPSNGSITLDSSKNVTCSKGSTITVGNSDNPYTEATTATWTIQTPENCGTTENITLALAGPYATATALGIWTSTTSLTYEGSTFYGTAPAAASTSMTLTDPSPIATDCNEHNYIVVGDPNASTDKTSYSTTWEGTEGHTSQETDGAQNQPPVTLFGYPSGSGSPSPCEQASPNSSAINLANSWSTEALGLSSNNAVWSGADEITFPDTGTGQSDPNAAEFNGSDPAGGAMTLYGSIEPLYMPGSDTTATTCKTTPDGTNQSMISITFPSSSNGSDSYTQGELPATLTAYDPNNGCQPILIPITISNAYCDDNPDNSNCPGYQATGSGCPITDGGALQWLLCPVYTVVDDAIVNALSPALKTFLYTPGSFFTNTGFQQTSATFRDIGIALLVIGGLVMVISQAAGLEIFAAYTIRKALPRLVIAMIGIALAVPILQFIVTFFNDIGSWIQQLILIAGGGSGSPGSIWSGLFTGSGIIATGIAVLAGAVIIISMLGTLLLAFLVAFLVLTIRQLVILVCIIIAPLAIASAVLPGTNKLWKFWENTLLTSLIMFPIIMAFLGAGMALSQIAGQVGSSGSLLNKTTWDLMAIAALIAPLIMLPFTFMMAGGLMSTVAGAVRNKSQGGFKLLSGIRQRKLGERFQAAKEGSLFREGTFGNNIFGRNMDRLARRGSSMAQGVTLFGQEPGRARRRALIANTNMAKAMENLEKNGNMAAITPNEDLLYAGMSGTMFKDGTASTGSQADVRKYLTEKGYTGRSLDQYTQQVMLAKRSVGARNFDIAAAVAIAGTGTGYGTKDGGAGRMLTTINRVAGNDRQLATSMMARASQLGLQAKRVDLGGAGFSVRQAALNRLHDNPGAYSEADATTDLQRGALRGQSAYSTFAAARVNAVEQLAPLVMKDLNGAFAFAGKPEDRDAMIKRQLAYIANAYDGAQSASPEAAEAYVQQVLAQKAPLATGTSFVGMNVRQMLDSVRGDGTFQLYRREYRSEMGATGGGAAGPGAGGPGAGGPGAGGPGAGGPGAGGP
jgi:hypothetical protein